MLNEVLLYGTIYADSASEFIEEINEIVEESGSEDLTVRVNSDGGEVRFGWGMISKFAELTGKKLVKNDGEANSMAAFFFCYASDAEAIDTAEFKFHRAGYPEWIEKNPDYFTEEDRTSLARMNKNLRKAFEAKVDVEKFNALGKGTVDEMFSMDGRKLICVTAQEAKKIGLINRINQVTPAKKAEIQARFEKAQAKLSGLKIAAKTDINIKNKTMDVITLKSEHPAVYAQIFELGKTAGLAEEKDRVEACLTFIEADPKGVKEAIASGKALSAKQMSEFALKIVNAASLKNLEADSAAPINTDEIKTKEAEAKKEVDSFVAGVLANTTVLKAK